MKIFQLIVLLGCIIGCAKKNVDPPVAVGPVPTASQLAWHAMEMNAFVHFSLNTFTGKEWGYGDENPSIFNPTNFNPDQWASAFKEAGFKGVILTCKHHDGFCLWPTKYSEHSVKNSPFQNGEGDIVKAVSAACKRHGLKFGIYLSPWDRNRSDYGTPGYITYYRNQLNELFTSYGPVFEMWFDGANGGDGYYGGANEKRRIDGSTYYDWPTTLNIVRDLEPEIIFFSDAGPGVRWVGNERGFVGETNWSTITPDTLYAGKAGIEELLNTGHENGTAWIPAEVDVSIRPGWFYHAHEDSLVKSADELFQIYLSSVGRGSTLLLNVPPDMRGLIHENDLKSLRGLRQRLDDVFKNNLVVKAKAVASSYRGSDDTFSPANCIDRNPDTYWATDDHEKEGSVEVTLDKKQNVRYIQLQEYIRLGQRIKSFTVDGWDGSQWKSLGSGTTVGYKRILPLQPLLTDKIRITVNDSKACPVLSEIALF